MRRFIECENSCSFENGGVYANKKGSKCKILDVSENEQGCKEVTFQFNYGPVYCKRAQVLEKWLCDNGYKLVPVNESVGRNKRLRVLESESTEELTLDDLVDFIEDASDYTLIAVPDYENNYVGILCEDEEGVKHNLGIEFHLKRLASNGISRVGKNYLSVLDMNGFGEGRGFFCSKLKTLETFEDKVRFCLLDTFYMKGRQELNNWKDTREGTWKFRLPNLDYVEYYILEILEAIDNVKTELDFYCDTNDSIEESIDQVKGFKLYHVARDGNVAEFIREYGIEKDDEGIIYLTTNPDDVFEEKWFPERAVFEVDISDDDPRLMDWRDVWEDGDDKEYKKGYYCYFGDIPLEKVHEVL